MYQKPKSGNSKDLEMVQFLLETAITLGAPAYNQGDHRGCYEVYACTARLVVNVIQGAEKARGLLKQVLENCSTMQDLGKQAWMLKEAFEIILKSNTYSVDPGIKIKGNPGLN